MALLRRSLPGAHPTTAPAGRSFTVGSPHVPAGASLSLVRGRREFLALAGRWQALEQAAPPGRHVFQSHRWLAAWAETYSPDLVIAAGTRGSELRFAWPLMLTHAGPVRVLRWLSEPHAQYGDALVASGECPRSWAEAALDLLASQGGADIIRLRHVRDDAAILPFLQATCRDARLEERAPSMDLTAFADEAAYEARYTASQRKRRKKIRKALEEAFGPLRFEVLTASGERAQAIRDALAEKSRWVDERGRHNRILDCARLPDFLARLVGHPEGGDRLVVTRLTAGGRPVSWDIGLRHGGTQFCFITAHVNELTDYSPARLHMDLSQRQALRDGMQTFDLMVPDDPYKDSWCTSRSLTRDFHLPLTAMGRLYGTGYLENLRPLLREAYHNAPPGLLRLLKPVIRH